jgi:hypothetical protein
MPTAAEARDTIDSSAPAAPSSHTTTARTGTPTADTLGFELPALPPAPTGGLAAADILAEAQAAGVRVLSCQLRGLDAGEPLQMRLLLDNSILELFFGTGEVLTTRVGLVFVVVFGFCSLMMSAGGLVLLVMKLGLQSCHKVHGMQLCKQEDSSAAELSTAALGLILGLTCLIRRMLGSMPHVLSAAHAPGHNL